MGVRAMGSLNGAVDLYAELRASGARAEDLPAVIAGRDAPTQARLLSVDQGLLRAILRHAAGEVGPVQQIVEHLRRVEPALMFKPDPATARTVALLTEGQMPDMPAFSDRAFDAWFTAQGVEYGLGFYGEKRSVYQTAQFADAACAGASHYSHRD